ncbi:MAG TPA: hypothetical protein VFD38_05295 [Myxococcaceae bacterium]|nr:hypothetical protein [Myxococcaceae bacterium]
MIPVLAFLLPVAGLSAEPGYLRLKRVEIVDRHGFEKPMSAMSMLVPSDWKFDGEVRFAQRVGDPEDLVRLAFRAASRDGRLAIEMFPGWSWAWADDPMMRQAMQNQNAMSAQLGGARTELGPPMSARDFVTRVAVPRLRPGARVLGVEPIPELEQPLQAQVKQMLALAAQAGVQMRLKADHARARIQLAADKAPAEEWLTAVVMTRATAMPSMNPGTGQMVQSAMYQSSADQLFALHTPPGELATHEKLFRTVLSTVRVDPAWQARVSQVQANMTAANVQGARDRSRIIAQSAEDTRRTIREGHENRQRSEDRNSERWSDAMRGVQNFRNPTTGEDVKLSNQYGHAWVNGNGEYVMSDTPGFNPGQALQGNWTELQPIRR